MKVLRGAAPSTASYIHFNATFCRSPNSEHFGIGRDLGYGHKMHASKRKIEIICLNRKNAEAFDCESLFLQVCVHDPDKPPPSLQKSIRRLARLDLTFDDVSYESDHDAVFSDALANKFATFVFSNLARAQQIVINCEMGVSRSAGLAAATDEVINFVEESDLFYRSDLFPNKLVHEKAKIALTKFRQQTAPSL